jgi:hypothetical protein
VQYCASRGPDLGPLGPDFGSACDQTDRSDAMLARLRDRARQGGSQRGHARPETDPKVIAKASRNSRTLSLTLDATTANLVIYAIAADAGDREAHAREGEQFGRGLPDRVVLTPRERKIIHHMSPPPPARSYPSG